MTSLNQLLRLEFATYTQKKITEVLRNCNWELRGSNPVQDAGYAAVFRGVPQSIHTNVWTLLQISPCLPFTSLPIHFMLPFSHPAFYTPSAVEETNKATKERQTLCRVAS